MPVANEFAAASVRVWGLPVTEKEGGVRLRPTGRPVELTETVPLNPFCAEIDTCNVEEVPGAMLTSDGVAVMVKDG